MFGAMNSGASPTIYAFSGAVLVVSFAAIALIVFRAATRHSGPLTSKWEAWRDKFELLEEAHARTTKLGMPRRRDQPRLRRRQSKK